MKKLTLATVLLLTTTLVAFAQQSKIIAHRGAWKHTHAPQNSIASLQEAIKQKVWGSEFDVHLTKDDILVVNHDNDFYGLDIATSTYEELLTKKHPNGESIPTAEEYLKEGLKQKNTKLIYELKTNRLGVERTLQAVQQSYDLVKRLKAKDMVEFIAFSYEACLKFRELDKKAKIHYLSSDKAPQEIYNAQLSGIDYHLSVFKKNNDWIKQAKALKLKTNVWTVNSTEDMQFFIDRKIDYITTDEPESLYKLLNP
ncbi:glycerophosphodiester phosphodiesterase family protein [Sphingobacterium sp. Mn56C]|uniref:glycerophosphodiester phosphodiesterase family protein n=1 Tax=Sphingobacterium sp. Mn56C TaxID=3395261 RepID=UPI003BE08CF1